MLLPHASQTDADRNTVYLRRHFSKRFASWLQSVSVYYLKPAQNTRRDNNSLSRNSSDVLWTYISVHCRKASKLASSLRFARQNWHCITLSLASGYHSLLACAVSLQGKESPGEEMEAFLFRVSAAVFASCSLSLLPDIACWRCCKFEVKYVSDSSCKDWVVSERH